VAPVLRLRSRDGLADRMMAFASDTYADNCLASSSGSAVGAWHAKSRQTYAAARPSSSRIAVMNGAKAPRRCCRAPGATGTTTANGK
jgi:hypothetical protein